jgi:dTDP-4-amino-4,6-dideoxygalactose transaminase
MPFNKKDEIHSWHLFTIEINTSRFKTSRDYLISEITRNGIGLSVHFIPLHRHPYWKEFCNLSDEQFPVATDKYLRTMSLPIYPSMTDDEITRVITVISNVFSDNLL